MPQDDNKPVRVSADSAREGTTPGVVRWMLGIGLAIVILGMLLIWLRGGRGH